MAFRAFVGVHAPPAEGLLRLHETLAASGADLRLVPPANLHATLAFLGDVPDEARAPIAAALDAASAAHAPFVARLHGLGAFPNARAPRVVWAGARDAQPLEALARDVRARLRDAGQPGDDKPFRAHVTLARVRSPRGAPELARLLRAHADDELGAWPVDEARLYRSALSPQGPRYEVVHAARLGGA